MNNKINGQIAQEYLLAYFEESLPYMRNVLNRLQKEVPLGLRENGNIYFSKLRSFALGGKKVRGSLVMLGYKIAGGKSYDTAMKLSIAVELFHAALLIHDDIMDHDNLRRGVPNLHLQYSELALGADLDKQHYGSSMALLMGDLLFFYSLKIINELDLPIDIYKNISTLFTEHAVHIAYGQMMDILPKSLAIMDAKRIHKTMEYKTAEYTGYTPIAIGAISGGMNMDDFKYLRQYGLSLGWAFQVQDDILGIFGDEAQLGKPLGSDLREGKLTLLQLLLYQKGNSHQRRIQQSILGNENLSNQDIEAMKGMLVDSGVYSEVKKIGWKYVKDAQRATQKMEIGSETRDIMLSLSAFMMERIK